MRRHFNTPSHSGLDDLKICPGFHKSQLSKGIGGKTMGKIVKSGSTD